MSFEAVFNHLVLPPQLPGRQDANLDDLSQDFVRRLLKSCSALEGFVAPAFSDALQTLRQSLLLCGDLNRGRLERDSLLAAFATLEKQPIFLHVVEQNAALIIRHDTSNGIKSVIFEAFEASPKSEDVLASENALLWSFPGRASQIPATTFANPDFQEALADFLEKASMDSLSRFSAKTCKSSVNVTEIRDTSSPALVTQMLMPLLDTIGNSIQTPLLQKRIRDDVNIDESLLPWRRHPFWLLLRVAVQRHLCLSAGEFESEGRALYKFLMAINLTHLLLECPGKLRPELTLLLRNKVCRRLAKLEMEKVQHADDSIYQRFTIAAEPWLKGAIESITEQISLAWENFKAKTTRKVERLPAYVTPVDLRLALPNSGDQLEKLLALRPATQPAQTKSLASVQVTDEGIKKVMRFTKRYFVLAETEKDIQKDAIGLVSDGIAHDLPEERCIELAGRLCEYMDNFSAYNGCSEHMSAFLLNLFDLWTMMDIVAVRANPLLAEYHPVFTPSLLDPLQLTNPRDMPRLQAIQKHLQQRVDNSRRPTVFAPFDKESFAHQDMAKSVSLQDLQQIIQEDCAEAREDKQAEWDKKAGECETLTEKIASRTCVCVFGSDGKRTKDDIKNCRKCFFWRARNRIEIQAFEEWLPDNSVQRSGIVFELYKPRFFDAYRNASWRLIRDAAWPTAIPESSPPLRLREFGQLEHYRQGQAAAGGMTLASKSKSFTQTHFGGLRMRHCSVDDCLLPFGPTFELWDDERKIWVHDVDLNKLTLNHICGVFIPRSLSAVIPPDPHPPAIVDGPSSYQVMASQPQCPQSTSLHEFSAWERLLLGISARWTNILVELGSSNLNFASADTTRLLGELAVQVGPSKEGLGLRDAALVFKDASFCDRLAKQIETRLNTIKGNYREAHCMDLLITLYERLYHMTRSEACSITSHRAISVTLMRSVRQATLRWVKRLREEVKTAKEASTAERLTSYAFRAALLCRRTFALAGSMRAEDLSVYVQATIALQEFIPANFDDDPVLRSSLIRDTKMAWALRNILKICTSKHPSAVTEAVLASWGYSSNEDDSQPTFTTWTNIDGNWVGAAMNTSTSNFSVSQTVHFNLLEGYLLVDGKPAGCLPHEIRHSPAVKALFGDVHLQTWSSGFSGMSHRLVNKYEDYQVHFGMRGDEVVIKALSSKGTLQYVPKDVFSRNGVPDLPMALLEGCVHWLNLTTRSLQIHRAPKIWKSRPGDWVIDLSRRECKKGLQKISRLICPFSPTGRRVAAGFANFERSERITCYQPARGRLNVDLPRFELSFTVNGRQLLEENKLRMEMDPNQDVGTWYGLSSKMVLRDTQNPAKRCVIVPLTKPNFKTVGVHVEIIVDAPYVPDQVAIFGRFDVDTVLGRLNCAPEPVLVFAKAHLHALTSFPFPDPLLSRTGVSEAIHILESGLAQPWEPFWHASARLEWIRSLAPVRRFYPPEKRRLAKTICSPHLTLQIQDDRLEMISNDLLRASHRLKPFFTNTEILEEIEPPSHLQRRGVARRAVFEAHHGPAPRDEVYKSRDWGNNKSGAQNVIRMAESIFSRPLKLEITQELGTVLRTKVLGGFPDESQIPSLNKLMEDPVTEQWGTLVDYSRACQSHSLFGLAFRLSMLAFDPSDDKEPDILRVLVAIARLDGLKVVDPPKHSVFLDFGSVEAPDVDILVQHIRAAWPEFQRKGKRSEVVQREEHTLRCEEEGWRIARFLARQWPCPRPSATDFAYDLIDPSEAMEAILPLWDRCHANCELQAYVSKLQPILDRYLVTEQGPTPTSPKVLLSDLPSISQYYIPSPTREAVIPCLPTELLRKEMSRLAPQPTLSPRQIVVIHESANTTNKMSLKELEELESILQKFTCSKDNLRQRYGQDLEKSLSAMREKPDLELSHNFRLKSGSQTSIDLDRKMQQVRLAMQYHHRTIVQALAEGDGRSKWLSLANLWPGTVPVTLLEQIRSSAQIQSWGAGMKEAIVHYGVLCSLLQWLGRVKQAIIKNEALKLNDLLQNTGHENWDPNKHPDWLLIELDGDLIIRKRQVDVARAIISPASAANSVFQLMMGQGKTSVIVPMALAVLAASPDCLARLVVPKALVLASAQILQSRIGSLVGRVVRHIPYSRRSPASLDMLRLYSDLHRELRQGCGVLLTTPDHLLSFKLSGLQQFIDAKPQARPMVGFHQELTRACRDVVDESDLSLGVRTQLIYPSGAQVTVDGAPKRWQTIEALLLMVNEHVSSIKKKFPRGIEIVKLSPKAYPLLTFIDKGAEDEMNRLLIDDVCDGRLSVLRLSENAKGNKSQRQRIRLLLTEPNLKSLKQQGGFKEAADVLFADREGAPKILLLVRGLLLNRILLMCLKKRWSVQYGLHPARIPIAVPFDSRGVPSEQSEWGHIDVAIALTCLSHFYGGLNLKDFKTSLDQCLKSDDPSVEYERFISGCTTLPDNLRHYYAVSSDDQGQVEELYAHLRLDRGVIMHFMNHFVFPVHCKVFMQKTNSSAWDIPLYPQPGIATVMKARTTGFSGTNDNRALLPLTITQEELPQLAKTNAEVLSYLLLDRNRKYHVAARGAKRLTELEFIIKLTKELEVRILIDAGAFILEFSNEALVRAWLLECSEAKGGVYFDQGRAWVLYRSGKKTPLVATPWADRITSDLLVYFDEAHCRGVDLKLVENARGALTLGPGQTKDATVQAAMRLRELATTQSIVFIAPPEVDASLRDVCRLSLRSRRVESCHVVHWLCEMTCRNAEALQNLHIAQGVDFSRRQNAQWRFDKFLTNDEHRHQVLKAIQKPERQELEQQYGPTADTGMKGSANEVSFPVLKGFMNTLSQQRNSIGEKLNGHGIHSSALEEVEQEREVEFQVEEVRQVAKPVKYQALKFPSLHSAILQFVRTGRLEGKNGFMEAFDSLKNTAIGKKFEVRGTGSRFYCSTEFSRTVVLGKQAKTADNFLRPVEWILWSPSTDTALIIIPEEAELLIPVIRRAGSLSLVHLLSYAAPVTKQMKHFNDLKYYALPTFSVDYELPMWLRIELGLFAGRLYVSYDECDAIKEFLRMPQEGSGMEDNDANAENGMVGSEKDACRVLFARNPIAFLFEWLALRRQVQDIMQTPMGYILQGRTLGADHPFFSTQGPNAAEMEEIRMSTSSSNDASHDDDSDEGDEDDWSEHDDEGEEWQVVDGIVEEDGKFQDAQHEMIDDVKDGQLYDGKITNNGEARAGAEVHFAPEQTVGVMDHDPRTLTYDL